MITQITHYCIQCRISLGTDPKSPWCERCDDSWEDQPKGSSEEDNKTEKGQKEGMQTQNLEQGNLPNKNNTVTKTLKSSEQDQQKTTTKTEKSESSNEWNGHIETKSANLPISENITPKTGSDYSKQLSLKEISEIQPEDSQNLFSGLKEETFRSMNFLTSLESELFKSMQNLRHQQPDTTVRLNDPDRAYVGIQLAQQIVVTMRAKLDLMKFARKLGRE